LQERDVTRTHLDVRTMPQNRQEVLLRAMIDFLVRKLGLFIDFGRIRSFGWL
jgi:hypothetical protein